MNAINDLLIPITKKMEEHGITNELLVRKLKEELEATETKVFKDERTGDCIYSKPLVSWNTRQKARQDAHRLRADYPADDLNVHVDRLEELTEGELDKRIAQLEAKRDALEVGPKLIEGAPDPLEI